MCGAVPWNQEVLAALGGSSLTYPCGDQNCYRVPLGFVGQAVIIAGARPPSPSASLGRQSPGWARCRQRRRARSRSGPAAAEADRRVPGRLLAAGVPQQLGQWPRFGLTSALPACLPLLRHRAAIILILAGLCVCRRWYVVRRGGRGLGLWGSSRVPSSGRGAE